MNFELTDTQASVRRAIEAICKPFDAAFWLERDRDGRFPLELHKALATDGWLGICMPEAYGGAGLGVSEAAVMMQAIAESGAGMSGASAVHMNIFGLHPVVMFGTDDQKQRMLPPLIRGEEKACFGVTEPGVGLNTARIKTRAVRDGDCYRVSGAKVWISTAQVAEKILLLARTADFDPAKPGAGLSLFYTTLDRGTADVLAIDKMARAAVDSNEIFFDNMRVPANNLIGEEGKGLKAIFHGFNPERILIAAEAVGIGKCALQRASDYARERIVFDRPIGRNQGIQHPLARCWMELEAAELMVRRAAWRYDRGDAAGADANAAKYLAAEAGFRACETAVLTHGGFGYAKAYHVERLFRESMLPRIAPVSRELILSYIAEQVLGQSKSY